MRFAFLLTLLAGAAIPVAASGAELQLAPRPISAAERAALELAADFAARGPEAIWERLDPAAPLVHAATLPGYLSSIWRLTVPAISPLTPIAPSALYRLRYIVQQWTA